VPKRKKTTRKSMEGWAATREPRGVIKQAAADRRRGLQDTDVRASAAGAARRARPRSRQG
jgi:hypothetical protein